MPETDKREEDKGLPKGSSGTPVSGQRGSRRPRPPTQPRRPRRNPRPPPARLPSTESPGSSRGRHRRPEYRRVRRQRRVRLGARPASPRSDEEPDLHRLDLQHMSEAFFAGWEARTAILPKTIRARRNRQMCGPFPR